MTALVSYAQNFEDVMLWRALSGVEHGRYVDIGAQDPLVDSVSQLFYEHGWRGVNVEPTPHYAELLRSARPEDVIVQAALDAKAGTLQFYEFPDTGLSTSDRQIAEQHIKNGFRAQEIVVPCITLDEVFRRESGKEIHWLKIDVEGSEKQVLKGWVRSRLRPWIVVVESTYPMTQTETHQQWESLILAKGYKFAYFDGLSRFYIAHGHDDLFKAFSSGPNVFDVMFQGFSLSATTPFCGALHSQILTLKEQREAERQNAEQRFSLREHELAAQLLSIEQQTARQIAAQDQGHRERESALHRQQVEREQPLTQQLLAGQQELRRIEQERAQREKEHSDQTGLIRHELESLLRAFATREQELAAQLLSIQQQATQQLAAQERSHYEREGAHQLQHGEKEQILTQQLQHLQLELRDLEQERVQREKEHSAQTSQNRQELESLLRTFAKREQELADQLLSIEQRAAQQLAGQERSNREREDGLRHQLVEREQLFAKREQEVAAQLVLIHHQTALQIVAKEHSHREREENLTQQLLTGQQQLAQREKEHGDQIGQARIELENLLRAVAKREQELAAQIMAIQKQTQEEIATLERSHSERRSALQLLQDDRELTLTKQLHHRQQELRRLEDQRKAENHSAQQASLQLRKSLAEAQQNVAHMRGSLTWRVTAPLRAVASIIVGKKSPPPAFLVMDDANSGDTPTDARDSTSTIIGDGSIARTGVHTIAIPTSFDIQHANLDTIMPSYAIGTHAHCLSVDQLMELQDGAFVAEAYEVLLGRAVDPDGMRNYTSRLREGDSKAKVIAQIAESAEAKQRCINLTGLNELIAAQRDVASPHNMPDARKQIQSVVQLMELHDGAFVKEAYQVLLGRAADPEGMRNYVDRLRVGDSKERIIAQIAASAEAKKRVTDLKGLTELVASQRKANHWLWGRGFRGRHTERQIQRLENQLGRMAQHAAKSEAEGHARIANIEHPVRQIHRLLETELSRMSNSFEKVKVESSARIASIEGQIGQVHRLLETELSRVAQDVTKLVIEVNLVNARNIKIDQLATRVGNSTNSAADLLPPRIVHKEYEEAIKPISVARQRATNPKFSVIILQFYKSDLTINCIRSLLRHTDLETVEIIVVDNGSSSEHITNVRHEFEDSITIIEIGTNRYFGEGNNIGVDHALGEFVIFMNNDIVVTRGWLDKLAAQLKNDADVIGPAFLYPDGRVQECGAYIKEDGQSIQQFKGGATRDMPQDPFECDYISAATILLKKETFLKVGGFDLCYEPAYYEDVDLCLKIASYGGKVICVPDVKIFHNENATSSDATLGLRLTNDIIETNKTKFLDRWTAFLSDRIGSPIERQKVIGALESPLRISTAKVVPATGQTALLYSPYPLTPGGGEKYLLTIAQELSKNYRTTLAFQHGYSSSRLRQLESYLNLDLSDVRLMDFAEARTKEWDVAFVLGNSIVPPFPKLSPNSFYICQFPFDRGLYLGKPMPFANEYHYLCYSDFVKDHLLNGKHNQSRNITVLAPVIQTYPASSTKEKVIISVGRFFSGGHCKNQHLLIEAFRTLVTNDFFKDWKLILIGSTRPEHEHRMYYRQCIDAAQGLNVEIIPDASFDVLSLVYAKAPVYWHGSGIGIDPSTNPEKLEHFGITPLEAASAGCHVFVPNAGGPKEIARKAPGRFYVYSSVEELVKTTMKVCKSDLFENDQFEDQMIQFIASFSLGTFSEKLSQLISQISQENACNLTTVICPNDRRVRWAGWSYVENDFRWSNQHEAKIEFLWAGSVTRPLCMTIKFDTLGAQKICIQLNGIVSFETIVAGKLQILTFDARALKLGFNSLVFSLPNAQQPSISDFRLLALGFRSLSFCVAPENPKIPTSVIAAGIGEHVARADIEYKSKQLQKKILHV